MNETIDLKNPEQDREAREAAAKAADYEFGWHSEIDTEYAPKGLSEDTVRFISAKKKEPEWMLEWRLKAYRKWLTMTEPDWAKLGYPEIDYQDAYYYAAPKKKEELESLDELDPDIKSVYDKLGIPLAEQEVLAGGKGARKVAVDAVFDSVSVATTFREELERAGVIFRSISEAIRQQAEAEGLDAIFTDAGAEWRLPGCSMCIAMNGDQGAPGELVVSTSNRNFVGRAGPKSSKLYLASPMTVAAAALTGEITDPREFL